MPWGEDAARKQGLKIASVSVIMPPREKDVVPFRALGAGGDLTCPWVVSPRGPCVVGGSRDAGCGAAIDTLQLIDFGRRTKTALAFFVFRQFPWQELFEIPLNLGATV